MDDHTLLLTGDLTMHRADEICTKLTEALENNVIVNVNCADATDMDVSFIQLVLAARKSAVAKGGDLQVISPGSSLLSTTLTRSGIQFSK